MLLWNSYKTTRKILTTGSSSISPSQSSFYFFELLPGPFFFYCPTLSSFEIFYRYFVSTYFHYCGTNPMTSQRLEKRSLSSQQGEEENEAVGVVDADLKVHGVDKLRVADASVFPHIPSAPIASVVMSVGLAAGELINGHNGQF
jgi:hypothetical protein